MPPTKGKSSLKKENKKTNFYKYYEKYCNINFIQSLIYDPSKLPIVSIFIIIFELFLNIFIVNRVNYTEIDWKAYMQECEGFLNGTMDYSLLKGDTGPLVYPAGFIYIYSIFYFITSRGENIRLAQYIFIGIYLIQLYLVLRLYSKSRKIPPFVLVISAFTSYRIHSIYVLRLFNDPIAILFLYLALNLFLEKKWYLGSIWFSVAISIKMNILLFAPAILLLYITNLGYMKSIIQLGVCGCVQLILGAPFLLTHPFQYIKGSFDLGRIFEHKWTVNYRFLSREIFENKIFHLSLLSLHLCLLLLFLKPSYKYMVNYCRLRTLEAQLQPQITAKNKEMELEKRNKNLPKPLKQRAKGNNKINEEQEEQLTNEQKDFLNMFEKSMKANSTNGGDSIDKQQEKQKEIEQEQHEKYSIHFDKSTQLVLLPIFLSNFIGILCARSLHYQFYVWYFHSLPYIAWYTEYRTSIRFLILALIELAWNTYPSTIFSSLLLHACHLILLYGICRKILR